MEIMKKIYILLFALFAINSANAQSCLPEGITFTTQAEIDNFQTNYPGCTEIERYVSISDDLSGNISNLNGLSVVTSIGGYLSFSRNAALTSLTGLDSLDAGSIANLSIKYNTLLSTCAIQSICDYLVSPNGTIEIRYNSPGCNSQQEVEEACANVGTESIAIKDEFLQ